VPPVTAAFVQKAQQRSPAVTEQGLMAGREAFTGRCASCHALPLPSAHSAEEWPGLVKRMAGMAKLDATQEQQVLDYVLAAREP
jgi:cytochrome c5